MALTVFYSTGQANVIVTASPSIKGKQSSHLVNGAAVNIKKNQYFNKNLKNPFSNVHERKIYIQKLQISIYQSLIDCIFKPAVHAIITCFIFSDR